LDEWRLLAQRDFERSFQRCRDGRAARRAGDRRHESTLVVVVLLLLILGFAAWSRRRGAPGRRRDGQRLSHALVHLKVVIRIPATRVTQGAKEEV
jgi:hypothetical protein